MSDALPIFSELGVQVDTELWELALTHRSFAYENGGIPTNERLEFLGDSVLGVIVTDHLYRRFPALPEGQLARLRAAVVNTNALADIARSLGVGPRIKLGHGEIATGGADKNSILADTMESIIGAVYLSGGIAAARIFVHHLLDPVVEKAATMGAGLDWKTSLQEVSAANGWAMPTYVVEATGPDHARTFTALCLINQRSFGPGEGRNKKQAEQRAAEVAFRALESEGLTPEQAGDVAAPAPLA